jgi:hypothetical protein
MDIASIIIWAVVIWIVSQILLGVNDAVQIVKLKEQIKVLEHLNKVIHQVKVEKVDDIEYWYDEDNNAFLGQGKSFEEVVNVIKSRFPNHIFIIRDKGGFAAQTNWKLVSPDEFQKINFNLDKSS